MSGMEINAEFHEDAPMVVPDLVVAGEYRCGACGAFMGAIKGAVSVTFTCQCGDVIEVVAEPT